MTPAQFKRSRERLQLSLPQLAQALGVEHPTVWRWEAGQVAISKTVELAVKYLLALHDGYIPQNEPKPKRLRRTRERPSGA
ncbi:MAG: hypothetical protein DMG13_26950 [Acidobacteria bacterium]|nr:MAG: hypothetical protein DMG13_26950 [Acidobacteriota bacterium]